MEILIKEITTAKENVKWLLEHENGSIDMHGLSYWAKVVEEKREEIKSLL